MQCQLDEDVSKFHLVVQSLDRAIQRLADGDETKSGYRDYQDQEDKVRRRFNQERKLEEMKMNVRPQ